MMFGIGVAVLLLSCLQSITTAVAVNHPTESQKNGSTTSNVLGIGATFSHPIERNNIASSKPSMKLSENPKALKSTMRKRDAEQEADSANGKSPIPFLYKKPFSYGSGSGSGNGKSKIFGNDKDYNFPPFTGALDDAGVRYQRQRRSYLPSESKAFASLHNRRPDEMEVSLDNERDREAFLRLMSFLASREEGGASNYNLLNNLDDLPLVKMDEDEGDFQDEAVENPQDLGYYGRDPYQDGRMSPLGNIGTYESAFNKPISLMSSGNPAVDLTRLGAHLSESPPKHGLYLSQQKPNIPLGLTFDLPGPSHHDGGNQAQRILDGEDEWLDDALPIQSHMKSRRSEGNSLFRHNPVKSHFRRYTRTQPADYSYNGYENGQFAPLFPAEYRGMLIRKRRNSAQLPIRYM